MLSSKASILLVLGVLALLLGGLATLTNQPATVITIVVPAWLRASGAVVGLGGLALWMRRDLWRWIDEPFAAVSAWLNDEEGD
jgi:hypothetical protein